MNIKTLFINTQTNLYLFSLVILFSFCDAITSILCMGSIGYNYESNVLFRYVMQNSGVLGFFIVKIGLTLIFLGIINYIIIKNNYFNNQKISAIYLGIIISNVYFSISNTFVLQGKRSFYLLQLNTFQIISLIIFCIIFCIIIILFLKNIMNIKKTVYSNLYKPIHRLLCIKKIVILELIISICIFANIFYTFIVINGIYVIGDVLI